MNQFEREEAQLEKALDEGRITLKEYNFENREMCRAFQQEVDEQVDNYRNELMGRW